MSVDFPTFGWPTRATNPEGSAGDEVGSDISHPICDRIGKWSAMLLVVVALAVAPGCEDRMEAETMAFEAAEVDYRQGNYADAMKGYQAFLERYPGSPLAPSAEMRLRSIHREVSAVMDQGESPSPYYHGSDAEQSTPPSVP